MKDSLRRFILEQVLNRPDLELAFGQDLLSSGILDSLGAVSLVNFIEEETGLEIPPEDVTLENFLSIDAIEAYLNRRSAQA